MIVRISRAGFDPAKYEEIAATCHLPLLYRLRLFLQESIG